MLLAGPLLFHGLGRAPFDDPGEGMHVEIARELTLSGDPFGLTFNGVRYVDKPPLLYVLLAGAFAVGGLGETSARAIPALAALGAIAATAWLGGRLLGAGGGVLAGLALATSTGFFAYARYVRPETLFAACLAWGFALALVGLLEGRRRLVAGGLVVFALAALAKDPLGALAPPLVIGVTLALAGRARPVTRWLPWPALVAGTVLAFGWWALAELRAPGFTWYTVVDNHVLNVLRAREYPDEDVPLTALQFLLVAAGGALPWVLGAAVTVARLARRRAWRDPQETAWTALALWAVAVVGVTVLSGFRLPHYGLPAYPALALLAARAWREGPRPGLLAAHVLLLGGLALGCAVAWASATAAGGLLDAVDVATRKAAEAGRASELPWPEIHRLLGAAAVLLGGGALAVAVAARRAPAAAAWTLAAVMLALMPMVGAALGAVASERAVRDLARVIGERAGAADVIAHEGPLENSGALEWYAGRRPVLLDGQRSVLAFGARAPGAEAVFWSPARLRAAWDDGQAVWVLSSRGAAASAVAAWPGATLLREAGGRALWANERAARRLAGPAR